MIKVISGAIKPIIPSKLYESLVAFFKSNIYGWHSRYYGEFGEDIVVNCLHSYKKNGFYIDIGCFHPKKLSTTYYFYKNQNWNGIVIDANPLTIKQFKSQRPKDMALNLGVGKNVGELEYFMFENASHNTFSSEVRDQRLNEGEPLERTLKVLVKPLKVILNDSLKLGQEIDYLNIDVEGLDLEVLMSNDWQKYRPKVVSVEDIEFNMENPGESRIHKYMIEQNYSLKSWNYITLIYERS